MVCIAAFIILAIIGIFVAIISIFKPKIGKDYLKALKKSWGCLWKKVRLQKCETGFKDDVKNTLSSLLLKNPQHFSVYGLILEKGTPLYRKVKNGIAHLPDVDQTADMYDYVVDTLSKHGYNRYEVSNFAQKGFECKHNLNYWDRGEYLGLGLSAHGFIDGVRYSNLKIFDRYFAKLNEDALPIATKTKISKKDACFEFVFLNLRKTDGFNVNDFKSATGKDFFEVYQQPFDELLKKGLIDYIDGKIKIKSKYFYVMNDILVEFAL